MDISTTAYLTMIRRDVKKGFENLQDVVGQLLNENELLRKRLSEWNKDEELVAKNNEIQNIRGRSLLIFSELEQQRDHEFRQHHYESCHNPNHYIYDLTGTGVGIIVKIYCPKCGESNDITDTSCW